MKKVYPNKYKVVKSDFLQGWQSRALASLQRPSDAERRIPATLRWVAERFVVAAFAWANAAQIVTCVALWCNLSGNPILPLKRFCYVKILRVELESGFRFEYFPSLSSTLITQLGFCPASIFLLPALLQACDFRRHSDDQTSPFSRFAPGLQPHWGCCFLFCPITCSVLFFCFFLVSHFSKSLFMFSFILPESLVSVLCFIPRLLSVLWMSWIYIT